MKKTILILISSFFAFSIFSQDIESDACAGSRIGVFEMDNNDLRKLNELIQEYVTSQINPNYVEGQDPFRKKYTIIRNHYNDGDDPWHNGKELFLSWHRDYIQGLENFLLKKGYDEFVPLPSWNPNNRPSKLLTGPDSVIDGFQNDYPDWLTMTSIKGDDDYNERFNMYQFDNVDCAKFDNYAANGFDSSLWRRNNF